MAKFQIIACVVLSASAVLMQLAGTAKLQRSTSGSPSTKNTSTTSPDGNELRPESAALYPGRKTELQRMSTPEKYMPTSNDISTTFHDRNCNQAACNGKDKNLPLVVVRSPFKPAAPQPKASQPRQEKIIDYQPSQPTYTGQRDQRNLDNKECRQFCWAALGEGHCPNGFDCPYAHEVGELNFQYNGGKCAHWICQQCSNVNRDNWWFCNGCCDSKKDDWLITLDEKGEARYVHGSDTPRAGEPGFLVADKVKKAKIIATFAYGRFGERKSFETIRHTSEEALHNEVQAFKDAILETQDEEESAEDHDALEITRNANFDYMYSALLRFNVLIATNLADHAYRTFSIRSNFGPYAFRQELEKPLSQEYFLGKNGTFDEKRWREEKTYRAFASKAPESVMILAARQFYSKVKHNPKQEKTRQEKLLLARRAFFNKQEAQVAPTTSLRDVTQAPDFQPTTRTQSLLSNVLAQSSSPLVEALKKTLKFVQQTPQLTYLHQERPNLMSKGSDLQYLGNNNPWHDIPKKKSNQLRQNEKYAGIPQIVDDTFGAYKPWEFSKDPVSTKSTKDPVSTKSTKAPIRDEFVVKMADAEGYVPIDKKQLNGRQELELYFIEAKTRTNGRQELIIKKEGLLKKKITQGPLGWVLEAQEEDQKEFTVWQIKAGAVGILVDSGDGNGPQKRRKNNMFIRNEDWEELNTAIWSEVKDSEISFE